MRSRRRRWHGKLEPAEYPTSHPALPVALMRRGSLSEPAWSYRERRLIRGGAQPTGMVNAKQAGPFASPRSSPEGQTLPRNPKGPELLSISALRHVRLR